MSGSTCNVILIKNKKIYCANVGDSRAILIKRHKIKNNERNFVKELSVDHKPSLNSEQIRILDAGGRV